MALVGYFYGNVRRYFIPFQTQSHAWTRYLDPLAQKVPPIFLRIMRGTDIH